MTHTSPVKPAHSSSKRHRSWSLSPKLIVVVVVGAHPSFSSSSGGGDLSSRQLDLLRQMLSTPDPRSFSPPPNTPSTAHSVNANSSRVTLSSDNSSPEYESHRDKSFGVRDVFGGLRWTKGDGRSGDLSSGSDHVTSDALTSGRSKSHSIDSGDSSHAGMSVSRSHPYMPGTWGRAGTNSSRPSVTGVFSSTAKGDVARNASRGMLTDESGSSVAGRHTTDDGDADSDWDLESDSGKPTAIPEGAVYNGISRHNFHRHPSHAPSVSTISSSLDGIPRLALTPENIAPLLAYAKEVRGRLTDCLDALGKAEAQARLDGSATHARHEYQGSMSRSNGRNMETSYVGTSSHPRG